MNLSVIIPAYNEAHRISDTLVSIKDYLSKQDYDWEVLVVSDGSKDETSRIVSEFASQNPNFRLIDNKKNHGKGYVVQQGMLGAKGDFRLFTDADNSTTINQIEKFWPFFNQDYDIVIGSIEIKGAEIFENAQWYRRFLGRLSKYLIRLVAGLWEIHDTQRGFKLFTAKASQDIFSRVKIDRFGFDIEVLAIAKKLGYKIKEVPVVWSNPGESKVSLKSYIQTFRELFKIRWNLWTGKYRLKI